MVLLSLLGSIVPSFIKDWVLDIFNKGPYAKEASMNGDLETLHKHEGCGLEEAIYLAATSLQPYNAMVRTRLKATSENQEIFIEWRKLLNNTWKTLSQYASISDIDEFASRITLSGHRPIDFVNVPAFQVAKVLAMNIADAAVVVGTVKWELERSQLKNEGKPSETSDILKCLPPITNMNFVEPHIQRRDYVTTNVATNGLISVISAENYFHNVLAVPSTLFLAFSASSVESKASSINHTFTEGTIMQKMSAIIQVIFYALMTTSVIMSFVMSISSMPQSMTDYAAARFLAIKWPLRYLDFILFVFCILILTPLYTMFILWGNTSDEPPIVFYVYSGLATFCSVSLAFYFFIHYNYIQSTYNTAIGKRKLFKWISTQDDVSMYLEAGGNYRKYQIHKNWSYSIKEALAQNLVPPCDLEITNDLAEKTFKPHHHHHQNDTEHDNAPTDLIPSRNTFTSVSPRRTSLHTGPRL